LTLSATQGFHYVIGDYEPFPSSGTIHYDLAGATKPTLDDGSVPPGAVRAGALDVAYGVTAEVTYDLQIDVDDVSYHLTNAGVTGGVCDAGGCMVTGAFGAYGTGAPHAALAIELSRGSASPVRFSAVFRAM